jgi:transaldolase
VFSSLEALGVDLDDVFTVLETEGVEKFIVSWQELLDSVSNELAKHKH